MVSQRDYIALRDKSEAGRIHATGQEDPSDSCALTAYGACCPAIYRRERPSSPPSTNGASMACGSGSTRALREQQRGRLGRDPQPSASIIGSQLVKTTEHDQSR